MQFRELQLRDLPQVNSIYEKYYQREFSLPNLNHTIGNGCILSGDEIIGFGMVKLYPEAIIILDLSKELRDKLVALSMLNNEAIKACRINRYNELKAHTINDSFHKFLIDNYSFEPVEGKQLQLKIEE